MFNLLGKILHGNPGPLLICIGKQHGKLIAAKANQQIRFTLSVARRRAEPLTLGWLDLDRFKEINDRYGHEEGDNALKVMAELMRTSFREADLLVRFGGDEFAVLFADTDEQGA
ncbi:GGDEF domain-containing protein, partial [Enterobacter cloacae]|uniref:GGDEF domain-containing protein n=1 Tax=Enterobacter cloacae TaxID=550 RepID=UPI00373FD1F4